MQEAKQFNFPRFWWSLAWLLVAAVILLSLARLPQASVPLPSGFDKFEHLFAYAVMCGYFGQLLAGPKRHAVAAIALFLLGAILELLQGMSGYRSMDGLDLLANSIGIVLGWCACRTRLGNLLRIFDQRIGGEPKF